MTLHSSRKDAAPLIPWVDTCKGLGIYLVVLGHAKINPTLHYFIYIFHMPLFFFLSGYLHSINRNLGSYVRRKMLHLLLPYASFLLLLYPIELRHVLLHHGFGPPLSHAIFAALWGGNQLRGVYGVFWFLPCLFFTQQIMNFLLANYRFFTVNALVLIALILSYANAQLFPQFSLPLDANVVLAAMPFFYLGFLAKSIKARHPTLILISTSGAALGAYLVHISIPISYDMRAGGYGIPGLSFILAICCAACVVGISKLSTAVPALQKVLSGLGAASMGIMFIHNGLLLVPYLGNWAQEHGYPGSILFTAISFSMTWLLQRAAVTRALLLGSQADFRRLLDDAHGALDKHRVLRVA